jgi:hypothetical protein
VQVGHHDHAHVAVPDPVVAQLVAQRLLGGHPDAEQARPHAAEVLRRIDRDARVQPGVDEDRPGAGMLDQEGRDGQPDPARARPEEHPRRGEAARRARQEAGRCEHLAGQQRVQPDRRVRLPARERKAGRLGLGRDRHRGGH